jgi:hypothetical protein
LYCRNSAAKAQQRNSQRQSKSHSEWHEPHRKIAGNPIKPAHERLVGPFNWNAKKWQVLNHPQPQFTQRFFGQIRVVAANIQIAVELIREPVIKLFVGTLISMLSQRNDCSKSSVCIATTCALRRMSRIMETTFDQKRYSLSEES